MGISAPAMGWQNVAHTALAQLNGIQYPMLISSAPSGIVAPINVPWAWIEPPVILCVMSLKPGFWLSILAGIVCLASAPSRFVVG